MNKTKKLTKIYHLLGEMGGAVQTGLVPYTLCGKRTKFGPTLISYISEHGPEINCKQCVKLGLEGLQDDIVYAKNRIDKHQVELDRLMPIWRKYVGTKPVRPSEY